jgi:hypothetical protein
MSRFTLALQSNTSASRRREPIRVHPSYSVSSLLWNYQLFRTQIAPKDRVPSQLTLAARQLCVTVRYVLQTNPSASRRRQPIRVQLF